MLSDTHRAQATSTTRRRQSLLWPQIRQMAQRLGWGVADQGMSSLTNFAVNIYIARDLGAVQYGAFSLAYVTYAFALNASRGLSTDPLLVRFSGAELPAWRRAVKSCTGTAATTGVAAGILVLGATMFLGGSARLAFLALGLTLPGLLLQDSWRFAFFALGRGAQALINDTVWALSLAGALLALKVTRHEDVFWFIMAWGLSGAVGAALGPLQARVLPRLSDTWKWLTTHRDLAPRYLAEGTTNSAANQLRNYAIGILLGLAVVGSVQAANTLMGPVMVVMYGTGLMALPEGARILRNSPRRFVLFCMLSCAALTLLALAWGVAIEIALPRGLGHAVLPNLWRATYPLVLPTIAYVTAVGATSGAGLGLHALGASRRSLRAMVISSTLYLILSIVGALTRGAAGSIWGAAIAMWLGALLYWFELRLAVLESPRIPLRRRGSPRHRGTKRQDVRR